MLYKHSIEFIRGVVLDYYPAAKARHYPVDKLTTTKKKANYILWMCFRLELLTNPNKASRWIGWIYRLAEELGVMNNDESRHCAKVDSVEAEAYAREYYQGGDGK
jgi:hypothetical protein